MFSVCTSCGCWHLSKLCDKCGSENKKIMCLHPCTPADTILKDRYKWGNSFYTYICRSSDQRIALLLFDMDKYLNRDVARAVQQAARSRLPASSVNIRY